MASEIRLSQLIAPFGPGSIYTDKNGIPTIICGLDYWFTKKDSDDKLVEAIDAATQSMVDEPRLSEILKVTHFKQPPVYRAETSDPMLSKLKVQGHRFPRWYVNTSSGQLHYFNLETIKPDTPDKGMLRPVRFIAVCQKGHVSDFPWKQWIQCTCNNESGLKLNDAGGADLSSITVRCVNCNKAKTLAGATYLERNEATHMIEDTGLDRVGIVCHGERPWLGEDGTENICDCKLAGVLINQSNIYFAKTMTSIFLPDIGGDETVTKVQEILNDNGKELAKIRMLFTGYGENDETAITVLRNTVKDGWQDGDLPDDDILKEAYLNLGSGRTSFDNPKPSMPESDLLNYRRQEFEILRTELSDGQCKDLRTKASEVPSALTSYISKINLVERLRETRVLYGFDRLVRGAGSVLDDMPDKALNQLFLSPPRIDNAWLPAVKNFGEGIYIELSEDAISKWLDSNREWLKSRYSDIFVARMSNESMLIPGPNADWQWAARYQLVHTLSHILINQLVFDSGYSSASLKERLFVSSDSNAPMAGILVYTAAGDSEGSLGGLVQQGRPSLFEHMLRRALSKASWCSADPVCSENMGGDGSNLLNMSACHACVLLPETACETINNGLDRAAVVGTPTEPDVGFFSEIVNHHE